MADYSDEELATVLLNLAGPGALSNLIRRIRGETLVCTDWESFRTFAPLAGCAIVIIEAVPDHLTIALTGAAQNRDRTTYSICPPERGKPLTQLDAALEPATRKNVAEDRAQVVVPARNDGFLDALQVGFQKATWLPIPLRPALILACSRNPPPPTVKQLARLTKCDRRQLTGQNAVTSDLCKASLSVARSRKPAAG